MPFLQKNFDTVGSKHMKMLWFLSLALCLMTDIRAQDSDSMVIRNIFQTALTKGKSYEVLQQLTAIGGRLSGTPQAAAAVDLMKKLMEAYGFDKVWLQPCMVPRWVRGEPEVCLAHTKSERIPLAVTALGNSEGTGPAGLEAPVIEIRDKRQLDSLGVQQVRGKIVFFNHPMNDAELNPFQAYGKAVWYRWAGPSYAARYGAVAAVVRSMTFRVDDYPHTGVMIYNDSFPRIPALALSTAAANRLSSLLRTDPHLRLFIRNTSYLAPDSVLSYNVIGELIGTTHPDVIITVGGHLDSWDVGSGAHDNAAGCAHSVEAARLLRTLGIRNRHTIRVVLFMNEENGGRGGITYAAEAKKRKENLLFALESDAGGAMPRAFGFSGDTAAIMRIMQWLPLFKPYHIHEMKFGGGGADTRHLLGYCRVVSSFLPHAQRYFDYHHAATDVAEMVNKRELEWGSAAIAALIYLVDKYGL